MKKAIALATVAVVGGFLLGGCTTNHYYGYRGEDLNYWDYPYPYGHFDPYGYYGHYGHYGINGYGWPGHWRWHDNHFHDGDVEHHREFHGDHERHPELHEGPVEHGRSESSHPEGGHPENGHGGQR